MSLYRQTIGSLGEHLAAGYLQKKGYKIIESNVRSRWGEIDLIALNGNKVSFIEVKTRVGTNKGQPYEAITAGKRLRMKRAADYYLLKNPLKKYKLSLCVISIVLKSDHSVEKIIYIDDLEYSYA